MSTRPPHPGETLKRIMTQKGITESDLIAAGVPEKTVKLLLRRLAELTLHGRGAEITMRLARATGTPVSAWAETQERWRSYRVRRESEVSEMRRRGRVR